MNAAKKGRWPLFRVGLDDSTPILARPGPKPSYAGWCWGEAVVPGPDNQRQGEQEHEPLLWA